MQRIRGWLRLLDRRRRREPETAVERILDRIEHEPFFTPSPPLEPGAWAITSYWIGLLIGAAIGGDFSGGRYWWTVLGFAVVLALGWRRR